MMRFKAVQQPVQSSRPDLVLLIPIGVLLCVGLIMVYSASGVKSTDLFGNHMTIFWKQLAAFGVGLVAMPIASYLPPGVFKNKYVLGIAVLGITALLIGVQFQSAANGAARWYYIGRFGFQPSDFAKLVIVCVTAAVLSHTFNGKQAWRLKLLIIGSILGLFSFLILLQPDFGTTVVIVFITGLMLYLAGFQMKKLFLIGLLCLPIVVGLIVVEPYRMQRVRSFFEEEHYQNVQARLAFGAGGLTGTGVGKGTQKLHYLPEPHTDFIFATLGEELGLVGTLFILGAYLFLLFRGMIVLSKVEHLYLRLLGSGSLLLLVVQALINISISLGLFPNKGLTLPFMSSGGSSLLLSMITAGLLLNVSRFQQRENGVLV